MWPKKTRKHAHRAAFWHRLTSTKGTVPASSQFSLSLEFIIGRQGRRIRIFTKCSVLSLGLCEHSTGGELPSGCSSWGRLWAIGRCPFLSRPLYVDPLPPFGTSSPEGSSFLARFPPPPNRRRGLAADPGDTFQVVTASFPEPGPHSRMWCEILRSGLRWCHGVDLRSSFTPSACSSLMRSFHVPSASASFSLIYGRWRRKMKQVTLHWDIKIQKERESPWSEERGKMENMQIPSMPRKRINSVRAMIW